MPTLTEIAVEGTQAALARDEPAMAWLHDVDETRVVVYRMAFGNARLCVGPLSWSTYDVGYCYSDVDVAIVAAVGWIAGGCDGEPLGWKKNLQTGEWREQYA